MALEIRFGVWGTGPIARQVAADLQLVDGAALHGVGSRELGRAEALAGELGASEAYEGLEAMLADERIDVVYVASPNHRHAADCRLAIAAGKAVLCEKPFAVTEAEARTVVEAARAAGVFCMEAMWTRFFPALAEVRRMVAAGELGRIALVQGSFAFAADADSSRFVSVTLGGGALMDVGVYLVSIGQFLLGEPLEVSGLATLVAGGADASCGFQMQWESGALGVFSSSLRVKGVNEMVILGERGGVRIPEPFYSPDRLEVWSEGAPQSRDFAFDGNGYHFQLAEVVACLREGRRESGVMPLKETLAVMRTMDRLRTTWGAVRVLP